MRAYTERRVIIIFMDGTTETVSPVGGDILSPTVIDGYLLLQHRKNVYEDIKHCGSYPLVNIRSWIAALR